ncbi:MAG: AMP-binding protein, partial [Desulfobacterales bacterium]|nr:AMP-binding protein [Desulfobacterales bacterium]
VTHGEIAARAANLRGGLAQIGVSKDDVVGIIMNNSLEYPVVAHATYSRGAWFIPMYEKELLSAWQYIMKDSGMKVVFVASPEIHDQIAAIHKDLPALEKIVVIRGKGDFTLAGLEALGEAEPVAAVKPGRDDIAGLIYTSGTTGDPKGVLLSHGNYTAMLKILRDSFAPLDEHTVSFSILPWGHVFGQVGELYQGAVNGASAGLMDSLDTLVEDIQKVRPTALVAVPRIFNSIYAGLHAKIDAKGGLAKILFNMAKVEAVKKRTTGKTSLKLKILDKLVFEKIRATFGGRLKMALTGSAVMNEEIKLFFQDVGIETYDGYGLTESSIGLTFNGPVHGNVMGSVGTPGKDIRIEIDKTYTGEDSRDGEVIAYGPNIMQGYYNKPEKTAEVMTSDGGFRTGDRGWLDDKGFLHITGRLKEEYKLSNGKYVHPASIEEDMKLNPFVNSAFLYGADKDYNVAVVVPDMAFLEKVALEKGLAVDDHAALLEKKEIIRFLDTEITAHLKQTYAGYEIPQKMIYFAEPFSLDNGLLTQTLKLKRAKLLERFGNALNGLYDA